MTMLIAILLGLGMPAVPAYSNVAMLIPCLDRVREIGSWGTVVGIALTRPGNDVDRDRRH